MTTVTDLETELTQARTHAQAADRARAKAEADLQASPHSRHAAAAAVEAAQQAAAAAQRLRRLETEWEEHQQAKANDRAVFEKAATKEIKAAETELTAAAARITDSAAAAQTALRELAEAAIAYNAVTARHADALAAKGLDLSGGENAGGRDMSGPSVQIKGRWHLATEPTAVVGQLIYQALDGRLPRAERLLGVLRYQPYQDRAVRMLADLPAMEAVKEGRRR